MLDMLRRTTGHAWEERVSHYFMLDGLHTQKWFESSGPSHYFRLTWDDPLWSLWGASTLIAYCWSDQLEGILREKAQWRGGET